MWVAHKKEKITSSERSAWDDSARIFPVLPFHHLSWVCRKKRERGGEELFFLRINFTVFRESYDIIIWYQMSPLNVWDLNSHAHKLLRAQKFLSISHQINVGKCLWYNFQSLIYFFHPGNLFLIYLINVSVGGGICQRVRKVKKKDGVCYFNPDRIHIHTAAAHLMQDSFVCFHSFKISIHIQCLCWDHQTIERSQWMEDRRNERGDEKLFPELIID